MRDANPYRQALLDQPLMFHVADEFEPSQDAAPAGGEKLRRHSRVNVHCFGQFLLGDALFGSVRNVNAPGPDEEGLPPRSVKRRNVRCESRRS